MTDALVVGSGASGVMAATALVEAGRTVILIDYGAEDRLYAPLIPDLPFSEIRRTDPNQHRYFLGDRFEGIPFGAVRVGAQLTPPRLHISSDAPSLMRVDAPDFSATESLALGGLAAGWGAGAFPFTEEELRGWPISLADLAPHYEAVAERIGISGTRDDLLPFYGELAGMLPPLDLDTNAEVVLGEYERRRDRLNAEGFFMGRTMLAICSKPHHGRGPHPYHDMDFWADDAARSVYRPRWTLEELQKSPHFSYLNRRLVLSFAESDLGVELTARNAETNELEIHRARSLVLAAGAMSTARIVLRSLGKFDARVPILSNAYTYAPLVNWRMAGREAKDRRHSLSQLAAVYRPPGGAAIVNAQLYSYRSLLTFKLMKESPLPFRESLQLMRMLMPLFGILGIHHEDRPSPTKFLRLARESGHGDDRLEIRYEPSADEIATQVRNEKAMLKFFRKLGCWPLKLIRPGHGSSIHYGGSFPMAASGKPLTTSREGLLSGTSHVYLADGSVLPHLPAKGLTFTLTANANRIGAALAKRLGS